MINRILTSIFLFSFLWVFSNQVKAQEIIEVAPLFEYPTAPEELESLDKKSNYLVEHFWDSFDFKGKKAVDQNALNHAFKVYVTPLRFADKAVALKATDKMLDKLSKNPLYLFQFTKAAEENLYGQRAEIWIDEIYIKYLDAVLANKKISSERKEKYSRQRKAIGSWQTGQTASEFTFENLNGETNRYFPMSTPTIIIFGDPQDPDWRLTRLKLETNSKLEENINKGKLNLLYIVSSPSADWKEAVGGYPSKWKVGKNEEIENYVDIRMKPSAFLIGGDGKLIIKNALPLIAVDEAMELM